MKFDPVSTAGSGIWIALRDSEGRRVGAIRSIFESSSKGPFRSSQFNGYLLVTASVWHAVTCKERQVEGFTDKSCRTRAEADKLVRDWIRNNGIREKLIAEAVKAQEDPNHGVTTGE